MSTAIIKASDVNLDDLQRMAKMMVASGYFDAARDVTQGVAQMAIKIMAGREMGYGPFASVQGIHVIQGKPSVAANLMAAAVKNHPRYDYRVRKMSNEAVAIEFFEDGQSIGISEFTAQEAKDAGLTGKDIWRKFPRNMLFARALSNGVRWYCPDVFNGNAVYVPEELGADVDGEGNVIDAPPSPAPAPGVPSGPASEPGVPSGPEADDLPPEVEFMPPAADALRSEFDTLGRQLYGEQWPQVCRHNVDRISQGQASDPAQLTLEQIERLIAGLRTLQASRQQNGKPTNGNGAFPQGAATIERSALNVLHALGTALHADQWDTEREKLVRDATTGAETSSAKLTASEGARLIAELERLIRTEYGEIALALQGSGDTDPLADAGRLTGVELARAFGELRKRVVGVAVVA